MAETVTEAGSSAPHRRIYVKRAEKLDMDHKSSALIAINRRPFSVYAARSVTTISRGLQRQQPACSGALCWPSCLLANTYENLFCGLVTPTHFPKLGHFS